MSDQLAMQSYGRESLYRKYTLTRGATKFSLLIIFLLSFSMSLGLTYDKFTYSEDARFSISEGIKDKHYGVFGNYVVLWPDEIAYINWIFTRADSFEKMIKGERDFSTNMYGYLVSWTYIVTGSNWKILFIIGVLSFLLFFYSCLKLLNYFCKDRPLLIIGAMSLISLSPTVINLTSGFMRDLLVIAVINFALLSILNRKMVSFFLCLLLILVLRNFMVVVLAPIFIYFYCYYQRTILGLSKSIFMFLLSIIIGLVMYSSLIAIGAVNKHFFEIFLRFLELITGLNQIVLNLHQAWLVQGALFVEALAHGYQLIIIMLVYGYIIKRKGKINLLLIPIVATCLLLAIVYGSFLGFFVARTKLIILWLFIVLLAVSASKKFRDEIS
jgi:hypothetical protein